MTLPTRVYAVPRCRLIYLPTDVLLRCRPDSTCSISREEFCSVYLIVHLYYRYSRYRPVDPAGVGCYRGPPTLTAHTFISFYLFELLGVFTAVILPESIRFPHTCVDFAGTIPITHTTFTVVAYVYTHVVVLDFLRCLHTILTLRP